MIKRITLLFAITGLGHAFSIIVFKLMVQYGQVDQMAGIAEVESMIQLMIGLIGFGLQTDAIRHISLNKNWKEKLQQAQTARLTLSILLMVLAVFYFSKPIYLCFLLAPMLATSNDYALYARGFSVVGAIIAFIRVLVPLLFGIFTVFYFPQYLLILYVASIVSIYFATNIFISLFLKTPLFYIPSFSSLTLYIKTLPLGVITICLYYFGLGILLVAQFFFNEGQLVVSFLALKFYLVYKGAIRVIQQAFVQRMLDERICLSIDQISILLGIFVFGSIAIFPETIISLLFGEQFKTNHFFFLLMSLSALIFSIFYSSATSSILENKDIKFMKIAIGAVMTSMTLFLVAAQFSKEVSVLMISLLVGEAFFCCSLALSFFKLKEVWDRISYLILCFFALGLPLFAKFYFHDNLLTYFISFGLMGIILLGFSYKKFSLPANNLDNSTL
jgi:hypothetical protein